MPRAPNLRQIEAFKAMVETGTVSQAAQLLRISQPAASKLLAHLEADTGMALFERERGRVKPNARGMRLYEEVDRIFAGLQQIERTLETIRREDREQLLIGIIPAFSGYFIGEVTSRFLRSYPDTRISLRSVASLRLAEWVMTRQLDFGIISAQVSTGHLEHELLLERPLVCVLPLGHKLAAQDAVRVEELAEEPLIAFDSATHSRRLIDSIFTSCGISPRISLESESAHDISSLVAKGLGVAVMHPVFAGWVKGRVEIRPFMPSTPMHFRMTWARNARNKRLVQAFAKEVRTTAEEIFSQLVPRPGA